MGIIKKIAESYIIKACNEVEVEFFGESGKGTEKLEAALSIITSTLPWYVKMFLSESTIQTIITRVAVPLINQLTHKIKSKVS